MERAAIEAGTSEAQLMEEAGLASAQEAWMLLGTLEGRQIVVLAGPGNNGGDGLVAARHLHDWGAEVVVVAPRGRSEDSNLEQLTVREVSIVQGEDVAAAMERMRDADLVVDALLGVGKGRPLTPEEPIGEALAALAEARTGSQPPKVLAIDLPTGLDADGGGVDDLDGGGGRDGHVRAAEGGDVPGDGERRGGAGAGGGHRDPGGGDGGGLA